MELNNSSFLSELSVNDFIDVLDTTNKWAVARIISLDNKENKIKVHYEGWSERYDEVLFLILKI
jgi:hypothetical protein